MPAAHGFLWQQAGHGIDSRFAAEASPARGRRLSRSVSIKRASTAQGYQSGDNLRRGSGLEQGEQI